MVWRWRWRWRANGSDTPEASSAAWSGGDRHGLSLLRSIAPAGQDWHQSEYRLTDARSEISIRPSRSSHFLRSKVRRPCLTSGSSPMAWHASSIVLVDKIVRPSPTRIPSSMNGPDAHKRPSAYRAFM